MDAHIIADPTLDPDSTRLRAARLPGEIEQPAVREGVAEPSGTQMSESEEGAARSESVRPKRQHILLAGVAVMALTAAAAGAFLVSPYNQVYPVPRMASTVRHLMAEAGIDLPAPLAPAASLANVTLPPPALPIVRDRYTAKPKRDQVAEVVSAFHGGPSAGGWRGLR
jgi:hypothetical protein